MKRGRNFDNLDDAVLRSDISSSLEARYLKFWPNMNAIYLELLWNKDSVLYGNETKDYKRNIMVSQSG